MIEPVTLVLVFVVGFFAGFFDTIIGAGGLISIPSLVFMGLPPQVAIATDRFGTIGQTVIHHGNAWLKRVFAIFAIGSAIKLLFF